MSTAPKRLTVLILLTVISFSVFWGVLVYRHNTEEGARQQRVELARKHAEKLSPIVAKDRRFESVRVSQWWGEEGKLLVAGYVETEGDLRALQNLVQEARPTIPVTWQVEVGGSATTNSIKP